VAVRHARLRAFEASTSVALDLAATFGIVGSGAASTDSDHSDVSLTHFLEGVVAVERLFLGGMVGFVLCGICLLLKSRQVLQDGESLHESAQKTDQRLV
jgi:hypothetical protein